MDKSVDGKNDITCNATQGNFLKTVGTKIKLTVFDRSVRTFRATFLTKLSTLSEKIILRAVTRARDFVLILALIRRQIFGVVVKVIEMAS